LSFRAYAAHVAGELRRIQDLSTDEPGRILESFGAGEMLIAGRYADEIPKTSARNA
jgi:hypothetical protein